MVELFSLKKHFFFQYVEKNKNHMSRMTLQCWYSNVSWNLWRCLEYAFQLLKGHLLTKYFGHPNSVVSALKHSTTFSCLPSNIHLVVILAWHGFLWLLLFRGKVTKRRWAIKAARKVSISCQFGPGLCYKPQHLYDITEWLRSDMHDMSTMQYALHKISNDELQQ